ncbi:MAG TPA: OmpA family protein [Campylobacterales bacterium]|nr:OmpA family protein [Campylobacterales bacterium]
MGSKLILLLGLLVGVFLTFMCVNENKTALSLKYNQIAENDATLQTIAPVASVETVQDVEKPTPPAVVELDEPIFAYSTTKLNAKLASSDKTPALEEFILAYCPAESCTQDLSFNENTKEASWQDDALKIAAFLKDKNVKNGAISIDAYLFNLEGELKNKQDMDELNNLLTAFDPEVYKMENLTTTAPKMVVEEVKTPSIDQTQNEISQLLKVNPIHFEFDSSNITAQSEEILNKVISLLKSVGNIGLKVEGHTDAGGNDYYNKLLSQKRADSVKSYLLKNGNSENKIEAIGYGEERPISSNPNEKINRRVEIHLKRGE